MGAPPAPEARSHRITPPATSDVLKGSGHWGPGRKEEAPWAQAIQGGSDFSPSPARSPPSPPSSWASASSLLEQTPSRNRSQIFVPSSDPQSSFPPVNPIANWSSPHRSQRTRPPRLRRPGLLPRQCPKLNMHPGPQVSQANMWQPPRRSQPLVQN